MTITSDLMEAFLKCPTKCFLQAREEVATGNAYADWVRIKKDSFRSEGITRLMAGVAPKEFAAVIPPTESLTLARWRFATDFTARGKNKQCTCHAVERIPPAGRGRAAQFVPIRFVFRNKLTRDDKLLLAFDAQVLSELMSREVGLGSIVHGDDYATLKVKLPVYAADVNKLVDKISVLLAGEAPPDLVLNRHCVECQFQSRCRQKAIEKDDLSLLGSMKEKERTALNSKGIFTVTQLSYTLRPRRRPKELKDKGERYHSSLKALAVREKKTHIVGTPELKIEGTPVYLDVEGLPDRDFFYLIGIRIGAGDSVVQHSLWADNCSDEARIWQEFLSKLMQVESPILIHYGSFESVFLQRMSERYGGAAPGSGAAKALESPINLLAAIFGRIYFPIYSNGLKELARWLHFEWSDQNASGIQSIIWRDEWEQTKSNLI